MKVKLRQIACNEGGLLDLPEDSIPVRLERNEYAAPNRKAYTLHVPARARSVDPSDGHGGPSTTVLGPPIGTAPGAAGNGAQRGPVRALPGC